jgi:flagellar hook assembly protein FlgD
LQNYPHPFNPETGIPYQLRDGGEVTLRIYRSTGELVRELRLGYKPAGVYMSRDRAVYWDGKNESGEIVSSGVYFYTIQSGNFASTKKMIIVR